MRKQFLYCSRCGKRILERLPNGLFKFCFGSNREDPGKPPVELFIHGSMKMKCLRRSCRNEDPTHWNVFNFFPNIESVNRKPSEEVQPISKKAERSGIVIVDDNN